MTAARVVVAAATPDWARAGGRNAPGQRCAVSGIAGGNFLILATDPMTALRSAEAAVAAIGRVPGVITPFPGGVVRSGSKVGSKYKKLKASTNDAFCPTQRGRGASELPDGCNAVY